MTDSFFSWKNVGFAGIFITNLGWMYYLSFLVMVSIINNHNFFFDSFESLGAGGLLIFISIFGIIYFLISFRMKQLKMITKKQYILILIICTIMSIGMNYRVFL